MYVQYIHITYIYIYINKLRQWFDVLHREGDCNNILSVPGFVVAVRDTLRIARGKVLWLGLPCNSCLGYVCGDSDRSSRKLI